MPVKSKFSDELQGPDNDPPKNRHMYHKGMIPKHKRWESKDYIKFVSELPCCACHIKDGTVVAHHLKGRGSPLSGGTSYKASDLYTMPLCFECHDEIHRGNVDLLNNQMFFILLTLDKALDAGVISAEYRAYETALIL